MNAPKSAPVAANPYASAPPVFLGWFQGLFRYDVLSIRQKLLTLAQKYSVEDEYGRPRFYVVRPPRIGRNLLAGIAAMAVAVLFLVLAIRVGFFGGRFLLGFLILVSGNVLSSVIGRLLAPLRHITVFSDESEQYPLLLLRQENKLALIQRYTLHDAFGVHVADFERDNLRALFRRNWTALTPAGEIVCDVTEDRLILAILRRYLGPMWGLLRTNFDFHYPDGTFAGVYNRKLTLTDHYLLDLRGDQGRFIDRRVALALGILLDTAEQR